jgi:hypothetical protein
MASTKGKFHLYLQKSKQNNTCYACCNLIVAPKREQDAFLCSVTTTEYKKDRNIDRRGRAEPYFIILQCKT